MKFSARLNNLRIAPRKVRLVSHLIKGLDTKVALDQLENFVKRANDPMIKLLRSAISNGENNFGIDRDNMYVFEVRVGAGPSLKRWMPRAFGRASGIFKRTSWVEITLEEREEGKGRKTKDQLEKEKKQRAEARKKAEKEAESRQTEEEKDKKETVKKEEKDINKEVPVRKGMDSKDRKSVV
jgi:large subunit ribosomal protein L22